MVDSYQQEKRKRFEQLVGGVKTRKRWTVEEVCIYLAYYFDMKSPEAIARKIHRSVLSMESKRRQFPEAALKYGKHLAMELRGHRDWNRREDDFIRTYCKRCIKEEKEVDVCLLSWCLNRTVSSVESHIEDLENTIGFHLWEEL